MRVFPTGISGTLVSQLRWANLVVGMFNLLPGLPLDGGRMLRAAIWKVTGRPGTSTIAAAWAGRVIAVALFVVPFATGKVTGTGDLVTVVWLAVIAAFMWTGAGQAIKATRFRERLPALQARRLARKAVSVAADTPLAEAIRRADENQARAVVVVDHEDKPIAILNESAVMATPPQRRPWIEAGDAGPDPRAEPGAARRLVRHGAAGRDPPCPRHRVPARRAVRPGLRRAGRPGRRPRVRRGLSLRREPTNLGAMTKPRHGPLLAGEPVRLTDPKGRSHIITLRAGASFHTHRGMVSHDDIIGGPDGNVVRSGGGTPYVVFRPLLADYTLAMKRGAAVVYPKDAAQIVAFADVFPGARVLEAGAGSGALSCWLLRAVGEQGTLVSFERRPDFAEIARRNVEQFFGGPPPAWQLVVGEFGRPGDDARAGRLRPGRPGHAGAVGVPGRRRGGSRARRPGSAVTWPRRPSFPASWRPCARTAASMSRPPGRAWCAAGTWRTWPSGRSTAWWGTPASWSPRAGWRPGWSRRPAGAARRARIKAAAGRRMPPSPLPPRFVRRGIRGRRRRPVRPFS